MPVKGKLCRSSCLKHGGFRFQDWLIIAFPEENSDCLPEWEADLPRLYDRLIQPDMILKHDHRSQVGLIVWHGKKLIVKKFLQQQSWWWFRLTSILFPSLGEGACGNALSLKQLGILTPPPLLLMQRIRLGMVTDSWLVYRFLDELPDQPPVMLEIVDFLRRMHHAGWIHGDSHPANFLRSEEGVFTVDPIQARPWRLRYFQALDVAHLNDDQPGAMNAYGRDTLGFWLSVAQAGRHFLRIYRRTKRGLRRKAGLDKFNHG